LGKVLKISATKSLRGLAFVALVATKATPGFGAVVNLSTGLPACLNETLSSADRVGTFGLNLRQLDDRPPQWRFANLEQAQIMLNSFTGFSEVSTRNSYQVGTEPEAFQSPWPVFGGESWSAWSDETGNVVIIAWQSPKHIGCDVVIQNEAGTISYTSLIESQTNVEPIAELIRFETEENGVNAYLYEPSDYWEIWRPMRPDTHQYFNFTRELPALTN